MRTKYIILLLLSALVFESCRTQNKGFVGRSTSKILPSKEYITWMKNPKNGMSKIIAMEDLSYVCQYRSYDYIICVENKGKTVSDSIKEKRIEELRGMNYFEFTIQLTNGNGELLKHNLPSNGDYSGRVQYFAFDMQRDVQIKYGDEEKQPCVLFHFERTYDVAPYARFLLGFEKSEKSMPQNIVVEYNDRVFNKGLMKFTFNENDFNKIPKLQTDK